MTQISGVGTVNAVYGRASQRFMPEAGTGVADTCFQHDLYGSPMFAADAQGEVKHYADYDIWRMPKSVCDDRDIASGLWFTSYDYCPVLEKHFAHARMYDPAQGRMLGADPVRRGVNGYAYCDNDPVNQTDLTGEMANVVIGGIAGGIIGGAFGLAGSALSQIAGGNRFSARKAWGAAANGAIVGEARGALIGSGAGIPLAFGVDFAAGMAGSLADQKIASGRIAPVRAAVDGVFNAAGGRLYGTSPLKNAKNAFIRGTLEGAAKGGAYNIADVLDNRLRNAYDSRNRRNRRTSRTQKPWNRKGSRPTKSRNPQLDCIRPMPFKGMNYPNKRSGSGSNTSNRNDRFRLGNFVRDVVSGPVMGGLASVTFYGAGKAVEALKRSVERKSIPTQNEQIVHEKKPRIEYNLQFFAEKHSAEYYFRGTSEGFPGNNVLIRFGITPTSTDPLVSTVFAIRGDQYGKGILYIATKNDLKNIEIGPSNHFEDYEKEICFNILPLDFAQRAHMSITSKDARQILAEMGYKLPGYVGDTGLSSFLERLPTLGSDEISRFVKMAREIMK